MDGSELRKAPRERSAPYPPATLEQSLRFIQTVDELGGKSVSYNSVLEPLGITSIYTKSFMNPLSASKQFGLVATGSQTIQLTDIARRILYPSDGEQERKALLIEAFMSPPLYAKLIDRYQNKALPPLKQLANILLNEYGIIKQVKDAAAKCFIESANYVGMLINGVLCTERPEAVYTPEAPKAEEPDAVPTAAPVESAPTPAGKPAPHQEEGYYFEIPTLGKKTARFYIPDGITAKDLDYIRLYVENMLPAFLDNLKSEM